MKKQIVFLAFITVSFVLKAQLTHMNNNSILVDNFNCYSAYKMCENVDGYFHSYSENDKGDCEIKPLYFSFNTNLTTSEGLRISAYNVNVTLYGPFQGENISNCDAIASHQAPRAERLYSSAVNYYVYFDLQPGYYIIEFNPLQCSSEFEINLINRATFNCKEETECQNCITSFSPDPGKYVVSGWVKELSASPTIQTYSHSSISVAFDGDPITYNLAPSGKIIDGWQRIEGIINIPEAAMNIHLTLKATTNNAVFDDIRFYPNDGSMMSYVYDPITLKLVAELDERNYATFYEYDEEGKLIRIKKETEKGIMTIQENRDNIVKKP